MFEPLDLFLSDASSDTEAETRRRAIESDPELRALVIRLQKALDSIGGRFEDVLPDRRILVLLALEREGHDDLLSEADRSLLKQNQVGSEALAATFASFDDLCASISKDVEAFDDAWHAHEQHGSPVKRPDRPAAPRRSNRISRWVWRLPVAAALVAFGILAYLVLQRDGAFETVATGPGEVQLVEYADGSTIRVMENSTLSYVPDERQSAINRRARLEGRAMFDIAPQQRGFVVETPTAVATVLGTMFGIDASAAVTDVVLVDGRLSLSEIEVRERMVTLTPGQRSRVEAGATPTPPEAVDVARQLEWSGLFIFRALPLKDIARRLAAHYDVRVDVHPDLADERITGTFDQAQPLEEILTTVAAAANARLEKTESGFNLLPA